nr:MAG TPA: hypothetical protein [Caudoviricetes sp.]
MKNKEKYAKEIVDIVCEGGHIAVIKKSGRITTCVNTECNLCLFRDGSCRKKLREWAESEYIEKVVISKKDRVFLDCLKKEYKFISRDENGKLFAYETQPRKIEPYWADCSRFLCLTLCFDVDFPMVKWEDSEPWLIDDLKKLEVVEEYENNCR